jgi:hypothetical protein
LSQSRHDQHATAPGRREEQAVDAVEFVRILSGRADGAGVLRHKLPL